MSGETVTGPDDTGSTTAFVVLGMSLVLVCAGLVIDLGLAINGRSRLVDDAEQAARVAVNQIDPQALRDIAVTGPRVDQAAGASAALSLLAQQGYAPSQVSISWQGDDTVTVRISDASPTSFLSLVGVGDFDIAGTATAQARTTQR